MLKIAIIKTGGKQYIVKKDDKVKIEKLSAKKDGDIVFDKVLLVSDDKSVKIGQPYVKDAKVEAKILEQNRDKKIRVVHYKAKTREHKVYGHRQPFTLVKINSIK